MKVRIILPVCLFLAGLFFAPRCAEAHETVMMTEKSDSVYLVVDELPTFPGGDEKLMHYKKGKVTDVKVVKSPD